MAAIALIVPTPDDGRTMTQWHIPGEDIPEIAEELRARFGEPAFESITETGLIDEVARFVDGRTGVVHLASG